MVLVNRRVDDLELPAVTADDAVGIELAVAHLAGARAPPDRAPGRPAEHLHRRRPAPGLPARGPRPRARRRPGAGRRVRVLVGGGRARARCAGCSTRAPSSPRSSAATTCSRSAATTCSTSAACAAPRTSAWSASTGCRSWTRCSPPLTTVQHPALRARLRGGAAAARRDRRAGPHAALGAARPVAGGPPLDRPAAASWRSLAGYLGMRAGRRLAPTRRSANSA